MNTLLIIVRFISIYIVALIIVRLMGKRALGQLSLFDLVIMAGIGDVIIVIGLEQQVSFWKGVLSLLVLGGLELFLSMISYRSKLMANLLEGKPTLLVNDGMMLEENMAKEHISYSDLQQELRQQGVVKISQVSKAVLEACGKVSVIVKEDEPESEVDLNRQLNYELAAIRQELAELKQALMLKES
ncbi:MAG: DUF421 domain-containing protein [Firmicutes bacterium]|nr:DUF421 domain-containing protein [Bacillota bacterium]